MNYADGEKLLNVLKKYAGEDGEEIFTADTCAEFESEVNKMKHQTKVYSVGFVTVDGDEDETQLNVELDNEERELAELFNLINSLWEELGIEMITHISECGIETEE